MKTGTELSACLLVSLAVHAVLIGSGSLKFREVPEQKSFEIEFETVEEFLPVRYELDEEKKIEPPENVKETLPDAVLEEPEDVFKESFLRYQDSIKQKIQEKKTYPRAALRIGYQGAVRIAFKVLPSGCVEDLRLVQSSQYRDLDREALDAVKRASPFRGFPEDIKATEIEVEVDIVFKISGRNN